MDFEHYIYDETDYIGKGVPTPENFSRSIYYPDQKFYRLCDDRPWYVVAYIDDDIHMKNGQVEHLILTKAYNKYAQSWSYKTEPVRSFLHGQYSLHEHYKDSKESRKPIPLSKAIRQIEET